MHLDLRLARPDLLLGAFLAAVTVSTSASAAPHLIGRHGDWSVFYDDAKLQPSCEMMTPGPTQTQVLSVSTRDGGAFIIEAIFLGKKLAYQGPFPFVVNIDGDAHLMNKGYIGKDGGSPAFAASLHWPDGMAMLRALSAGSVISFFSQDRKVLIGSFSLAQAGEAGRDLLSCTSRWLR